MRALIVGFAAACAAATVWVDRVHADESSDVWYEIQVDTVVVDSKRPGNAGTWDEAKNSDGEKGLCVFAIRAGAFVVTDGASEVAAPVTKEIAGAACDWLTKKPQQERDPKAPDLLLRLSADGVGSYWSGVAWNSYQQDFGQKFYVPAGGIPSTGIKLSVLDHDAGQEETITTIRLSKKDLDEVAAMSPPMKVFKSDALKQLELIVRPASLTGSSGSIRTSASASFAKYPKDIPAGATVQIRAAGKYKLGGFAGSTGPEGIGKWSEYNLKLFEKAKHGASVAILSDSLMGSQAIVVGKCTEVVAAHSGRFSLGVNDREPGNNSGALVFTITITPPSVDTWRKPGTVSKCTTPSAERVVIGEKVVVGLEGIASAAHTNQGDCGNAARGMKAALDAAKPDFTKAAALRDSEDTDASGWFDKAYGNRVKAAMEKLKPVAEKCERNTEFMQVLSEIAQIEHASN